MKSPRFWYKILVGVLSALFLGVCVYFGSAFFTAKRELQVVEAREAEYRAQIAEKAKLYQQQHSYLKKMLYDQAFFEKVVRERLKYSREDELIFRYPKK